MPGPANSSPRAAQLALSVLFLGVISLPLLDSALGLDPAPPLRELRQLRTRPKVSLEMESLMSLPRRFEPYYDDQFGFRRSLIQWHSRWRLLARENPFDAQVLLGKSRWLYLNKGGGLMDDHRAIDSFSTVELEAIAADLQKRSDLLAAFGARYLYVIAPDKSTTYPEFVPDRVQRFGSRSRFDQLIDFLLQNTGVEVVDLRQPLETFKPSGLLYHRTDTHWNQLGAWVAYREIQNRVATRFPGTAPLPLESFEVTIGRRFGLGLASMLGLAEQLEEEEWVMVAPRSQFPQRATRIERNRSAKRGDPGFLIRTDNVRQEPFAMATGDPSLPRAVVFRDSFATALVPLLSEHYERIVYYHQTTFDYQAILYERPDVVIDENVERLAVRIPVRGPLHEGQLRAALKRRTSAPRGTGADR